MAKSVSWSQHDWAAFHLLKTKLKTERPTNTQPLKTAAVKNPVSADVHEFQTKGSQCLQKILNKILQMNILFMITFIVILYFYIWPPEHGGSL